jgi:hypothetical protein
VLALRPSRSHLHIIKHARVLQAELKGQWTGALNAYQRKPCPAVCAHAREAQVAHCRRRRAKCQRRQHRITWL